MKTMLMAAAAALTLAGTTTTVHAATLTFDDLTGGCYGSGFGCPLLPNMAFDGTNLTYTSGDYILSFAGGDGAHIGDGTNSSGTYNWHDGPVNSTGSLLSLSRVDGTAFDLTGFDYSVDSALTVTATGFASLVLAAGSGTASPAFANVRSVSFASLGFANQLDNIVVNASVGAVPEPATWAMMMLGFGGIGMAMRRRAKVGARIRFA